MSAAAPPAIWGVVLAGGRSTRMGRDKATLEVAPGVRLVDRVVAAVAGALREAGDPAPRVLVSGDVPGHECVPDAAPGLGPVAGLAAALDRARAAPSPPAAVLAVPVDLPALAPAALLPLLAAASPAPAPAAYAGSALPALFPLDARTAEAVARVLASSGRERSVTRLLALLGARELPLDPAHEALLRNANTPQELSAALSPKGDGP